MLLSEINPKLYSAIQTALFDTFAYGYGPDEWEMAEEDFRQYLQTEIAMMNRPKIVVICGSSKFTDIMAVVEWIIERDELAITMGLNLLPQWYPDCPPDHLAEAEGCADEMDELHLRKIDLADEIFVVDWDDYIGESTSKEIKYAEKHGKQIRFFSCDIVGQQVCELITKSVEPTGIR